jgi:uncharacterized OB-fold protein
MNTTTLFGNSSAVIPPRPAEDSLTAFFWQGARDGKLLILRCRQCQSYIHWPRPVCRFCLATDLSPAEVSGRGRLHTYTSATQAFHPYFLERVPYIIATVELEEQPGLMMVSNLVGVEPMAVQPNMLVEVLYREVAPGLTLPLFEPATTRRGGDR